ncbi:Hypothetical protein NTJ_12828 [Nesidiocoris tenuis]|uniref:Chloride channel CLIC-like protein 1 n=1 Tax=Nesidiocoris tenuis TaxID=355587 RepID=A0ABN7B821_9HEMI|nr:Hypothetical protein NTJ_12828 [Nesidiocoris tenuis]
MGLLPICCFFIFVCLVPAGSRRHNDDWQDPNDIFGRTVSPCGAEHAILTEDLLFCKDELDHLREANGCRGPRVVKEPSPAERYLKRFINVLLASSNFKHRKLAANAEMKVNIDLHFDSTTLEVLQAFASDDRNGFSWEELDTSFLTIFESQSSPRPLDDIIPGIPGLSVISEASSHVTILIGIVGSVACCILWIYFVSNSFKSTLFVGAVIVVSMTFGWFWWAEIEEQKMKSDLLFSKMSAEDVSQVCDVNHTMWSWLWGKISNQDRKSECMERLKAGNPNAFAKVDMNRVFEKTTQAIAFSWLPALGSSLSGYFDNLYGKGFFGSVASFCSSLLATPTLGLFIAIICLLYYVSRANFRVKNWLFEVSLGDQRSAQQQPQGQPTPRLQPQPSQFSESPSAVPYKLTPVNKDPMTPGGLQARPSGSGLSKSGRLKRRDQKCRKQKAKRISTAGSVRGRKSTANYCFPADVESSSGSSSN